jgi:hypothetical protein
MRNLFQSAIGLLLALMLGGCFESELPLIAAQEADYPFERGFHYTFYEWNKEARNWEPSETGSVQRDGDHYMQLADVGVSDKGDPFLLKSIGDNYYIAQKSDNSSSIYVYDLVRINGNIVYEYGLPCTDEDRKFVAQGLIDSFTVDSAGNRCSVSSLDKLARVFRAITAERPQPQGMYGLDK